MAPIALTEYERRRLENIKRNDEMMAALKLQSRALELSAKRQRIETKSYKISPEKKPKSDPPVIIRRSLRARGIPPDSSTAKGLEDDAVSSPVKTLKPASPPESPVKILGPLSMRDVCAGQSPDQSLLDSIKNMAIKAPSMSLIKRGSFDLGSLVLEPENIARVMPGRILNVEFFPSVERTVVVAGNKFGNLAFWDVWCEEGGGDGVYLYLPHTGPISGISILPFTLSKVFTSSYDGQIRLMDVENESFDLVYSSEDAIFSLSQQSNDVNSLYFSEALGELDAWDVRAGKSSSSWVLHNQRINTIDFNPENTNLMATSSTDGTACIWDLRSIAAVGSKYLTRIDHKRAVHSAYFSPSGNCLATTSVNDSVGILSGVDYSDKSTFYHMNQTGRWISSFRAIWGWDDSRLLIGNMDRGVDVISTMDGKIMTLESPHISAIPCRFAAHPYKVGTLATATSGGQVYLWTSRQQRQDSLSSTE